MKWFNTLLLFVALVAPVNATDLGPLARYDDATPAAIALNDQLIQALLDSFPISGGSLDIREGELHVSKPIRNPVRVQLPPGSPGPAPLNFAIEGHGASSRIVFHPTASGPLVDFSPTTPALYRDGNVRLRISNVTLQKAPGPINATGVNLFTGGKWSTLRDVVITGFNLGLNAKYYDGGCLDNVYVHHNEVGAIFDTCMLMQCVRFTSRENTGDGVRIKNCSGWSGQFYVESNRGLQADLNGLRRSSLDVWVEDTGSLGFRPLVKRRNCLRNLWRGTTQDDRIFDDDAVSTLLNLTQTDSANWSPIGEPVGAPTDFAAYSGRPLFHESGLTAICEPGCFRQAGVLQGELRGFDPTSSKAWKAGDYLQVSCDVVTDDVTRMWCGDRQPFMLSTSGGTFPECKANVRLLGPRTRIVVEGAAPTDGKGVRLFVTLLGMPGAQPLKVQFAFENLKVNYLKNSP